MKQTPQVVISAALTDEHPIDININPHCCTGRLDWGIERQHLARARGSPSSQRLNAK